MGNVDNDNLERSLVKVNVTMKNFGDTVSSAIDQITHVSERQVRHSDRSEIQLIEFLMLLVLLGTLQNYTPSVSRLMHTQDK